MNYVIMGPRNEDASTRLGVFGDIVNGKTPNACIIIPKEPTSKLGMKAERLSKKKRIPLWIRRLVISPWEMKYRDLARCLKKSDDNCIIFCVCTLPFLRIPQRLLWCLRLLQPKCKLVYYLIDGVDRVAQVSKCTVDQVLSFMKQFDAVFTYDSRDAETYHYRFLDSPVWMASDKKDDASEYDVYFCGRDKGRTELLTSIAKRLQAEGLTYEFVVPEEVKDEEAKKHLTVKPWRPYPETVEEMRNGKCVLEILAKNNYGPSLRYREAVMYNRKLLTNNPGVVSLPYYDPRWMKVFSDASDIDIEWLRRCEPVDYGYKGDFSAKRFLEKVEAALKEQ